MSTPPTDYSAFCGEDLRDLCRGRGLRASGRVDELVERLRADDAARVAREAQGRVKAAGAVPATVGAEQERALTAAYAAGLAEAVRLLIARAEGRERQGEACLKAQGAYDALCVKANELRAAAEVVWLAIPEAYRGATPKPEALG